MRAAPDLRSRRDGGRQPLVNATVSRQVPMVGWAVDTYTAGAHTIAMTANVMESDREKCTEAGMNDHLAKPIDPEALFACLLRWVKPRAGIAAAANVGKTLTPTIIEPQSVQSSHTAALRGPEKSQPFSSVVK